jgi:hypothetical protein
VRCQDNNLSLNVSKTKELIVEYRKRRVKQAPINIDGAVVDRGRDFQVPWCPHHQQELLVKTSCITAWYGNCSGSDRKVLQRVVQTAQYNTGAKLPAIQDLYNWWCQKKAHAIVRDSSHPSYRLFSLLTARHAIAACQF